MFAQVLDHDANAFAAQDEEHFLGIGVEMQRAFAAGGQHHGREGEMLGRDRVRIGRHAGRAGADVAHLGALVLRIVVGLELEGVPVERPGLPTCHARFQPLAEGLSFRDLHVLRQGFRRARVLAHRVSPLSRLSGSERLKSGWGSMGFAVEIDFTNIKRSHSLLQIRNVVSLLKHRERP